MIKLNSFIICNKKITPLKFATENNGSLTLTEWMIESKDGKEWFKDGKRHRDNDLPAVETAYSIQWWKNGKRHRDNDLPAQIEIRGKEKYEHWWINGKRHREGDKPTQLKIGEYGFEIYHKNGKLHREGDKPASMSISGHRWYKNGKRHRENGPAVIYQNGKKEYWIEGKYLTEEEFLQRTENPEKISKDFQKVTQLISS